MPRFRIVVARRRRSAELGDQRRQRLSGALLEGRPLRLAVVGQDDDLVRAGDESRGPLDPPDLAVEVTQHGQGVDAFGPGVVGDLVVAEHVDVDGSAPLAHVVDHTLHRHVAGDHRRERAQQGVDPASLDAGLDAPPPLLACRQPLASDLDDRGEQRPRRLART